MKKRHLPLIAVSLLCCFVSSTLKAQENSTTHVCFTDGVYQYYFPSLTRTGSNSMADTGHSNAFGGSTVILSAVFNSPTSGKGTMKVINSNADGCANGIADSFVYKGIFTLIKSGNTITGGAGNGDWINYCSGVPTNTGFWTAGACGSTKPLQKVNSPSPTLTGKKISESAGTKIFVAPNPAVNQTRLYYKVHITQNVSIIIYSNTQQPVATLVNEIKAPGNYSVAWNLRASNGNICPAGVYRVVIRIGDDVFNRAVQVIR